MSTSTARVTWELAEKWEDLADPDELSIDAHRCAACDIAVGPHWNEDDGEGWAPIVFVESYGKESFLCQPCLKVINSVAVIDE